jgi:glycosyltransferase involved in cell wall biosynthesis
MCNSKKVARELKEYANREVYYAPTSSISEKDIRPFNLKSLSENQVNLIFCGRITPDIGVIELFEAIGRLNLQNSKRFKLTMVGSVDDNVKSQLKFIAAQFDFEDSVDWLGFIPFGEDLFDIISLMDFCILPSYHEGFPHIIWEAGICSVPMITTNVGGVQDLVSENEVTFIIKKSAESIYDEVLKLMSDYELRRKRAVNLYELACKASLEKNAEILVSFINRKF